MTYRNRLVGLMGGMQRDLMPSLVRMHEQDNLRLLDAVVLQVVDRAEQPTVKEISVLIGRSTSRTSRIIDQLVRGGLVGRTEDDADRRIRRIGLLEPGRTLIRQMQTIRADATLALFDTLNPDEQETVMAGFELLATAARRVRDDRDPPI